MKVEIDAFVVARQTRWENEPVFAIYPYNPQSIGSDTEVLISKQTFVVDVPDDFDPRPEMVAMLNKRKDEIRAKFAESVRLIDEQINSLLAIEHK